MRGAAEGSGIAAATRAAHICVAAEIWSLYKKCDGSGHFLLLQYKFFFCDMVFIMVLVVLVLVFWLLCAAAME